MESIRGGTRASRRALLGGLLAPAFLRVAAAFTLSRPVFQVDVPAPTKDKPQSKLWFAHDAWWAWLPVRGGSAIWKRTATGWSRETSLDAPLQGYPGQADVYANEDRVDAVLVAPDQLAVAGLQWQPASGTYRLMAQPQRFPASAGDIETATIARDGRGRQWIAYNLRRSMWVRASTASGAWTSPIRIDSAEASPDDICAIIRMPGAVGVIWSDQAHDAVYFRLHPDAAPESAWHPAETADSGGKTADDHINAVAAADGTLYIATKNSVDLVGRPQLILRIRDPRGKWTNLPYATRLQTRNPLGRLFFSPAGRIGCIYSIRLGLKGRKTPASQIMCQVTNPASINVAVPARVLIDAAYAVNNATRSKEHAPHGHPAMVLASDNQGNVYEGRLS